MFIWLIKPLYLGRRKSKANDACGDNRQTRKRKPRLRLNGGASGIPGTVANQGLAAATAVGAEQTAEASAPRRAAAVAGVADRHFTRDALLHHARAGDFLPHRDAFADRPGDL